MSLSCPVAAKMILECQEPVKFLEEQDEQEECEDDFEDFDFLLFDCLLEVREKLFSIVQNRKIPVEKRMFCVLRTAKNLQDALDEGELFERDFISDMELYLQEEIKEFSGSFYETVQVLRKDLLRLEVLREEWKANLKAAENLFQKGEIWYMDKRERYKAEIKNTIAVSYTHLTLPTN